MAEVSCCPPDSAPYLDTGYKGKGKVGDADGVPFYRIGRGRNGLLLLPDVWGWNGGRTRAVADELARKGLQVWVPKLLAPFEGGTDDDGLPPGFSVKDRGGELGPLLKGDWHTDTTLKAVLKVVASMRTAGVKKFGVLGVCYGCWLGFHLSKEVPATEFVCGASAHPSAHVEGMIGGSTEELAKKVQCPWLLFPCGDPAEGGDPAAYDKDGEVFKALEENMPGKNETKRLTAMQHGFFARGAHVEGDPTGDDVKKAIQDTFDEIVAWFTRYELLRAPVTPSVGMKLHALYSDGEYYPAEIMQVSESKKRSKAPFKVHYVGYDKEEDAWLALTDLKSKKLPKPPAEPKDKAKAKAKPRRKPPPIKITYFAIEGVAEKIRLALTLGEIPFDDDRIAFDSWQEMKPKTKYGQLPMMKIGDGEPFAQSGAMLRYCGRLARLYPPSALLKIEEVIGVEEDLGRLIQPTLVIGRTPATYGHPEDMPEEDRKKLQVQLRETLIAPEGGVRKLLASLDGMLKDDSPFLCGKAPTIADCQVIPRLRHFKKGILDGIPATIIDDFPNLTAYFNRFHELPLVKAYYEKLEKPKAES